jgi:hypothetical protein
MFQILFTYLPRLHKKRQWNKPESINFTNQYMKNMLKASEVTP